MSNMTSKEAQSLYQVLCKPKYLEDTKFSSLKKSKQNEPHGNQLDVTL